MKVYEITLTLEQLGTITDALEQAAAFWTDQGADPRHPDLPLFRERATRNRLLAHQMDKVVRDFAPVER